MSIDLNEESFDPGQRRLCPDGACVGVIGEDGRCRLCGAEDPNGPPPVKAPVEPSSDNLVEVEPAPEAAPAPLAEGGFDPNRRLCVDDTCIGVLDERGRCKVCGRLG